LLSEVSTDPEFDLSYSAKQHTRCLLTLDRELTNEMWRATLPATERDEGR
jgi:hypothetical protein